LTVAVIRPEDRSAYYDALVNADDGDCNPLAQLICRSVVSADLDVYDEVSPVQAAKEFIEEVITRRMSR